MDKQYGNKEKLLIKKASLNTCKLVVRKNLISNKNLNNKVVFIILILLPTTVPSGSKGIRKIEFLIMSLKEITVITKQIHHFVFKGSKVRQFYALNSRILTF